MAGAEKLRREMEALSCMLGIGERFCGWEVLSARTGSDKEVLFLCWSRWEKRLA